jgi:methionyl-tRNA synthetase
MIGIEDFAKVELKVAIVRVAERIEGSDKLLKLQIEAGDVDELGAPKMRQLVAGIGKAYAPETLIGKRIVIIANLEPRSLMGFESQGMILAATDIEKGLPVILTTDGEVGAGSKIK